MRRRGKYNAHKTVVDGTTFASKAEARRYCQLKDMETRGEIYSLGLQKRFPLWAWDTTQRTPAGIKVCDYVADFVYYRKVDGEPTYVVEDAKGSAKTITPLFRLKKKMMLACHGIEVKVVIMGRESK